MNSIPLIAAIYLAHPQLFINTLGSVKNNETGQQYQDGEIDDNELVPAWITELTPAECVIILRFIWTIGNNEDNKRVEELNAQKKRLEEDRQAEDKIARRYQYRVEVTSIAMELANDLSMKYYSQPDSTPPENPFYEEEESRLNKPSRS